MENKNNQQKTKTLNLSTESVVGKTNEQIRKPWFNKYKAFMRFFKKAPTYIYLGKKYENGSIILCNHVGTNGPLSYELYSKSPLRFWGAHQMNSGFKKMYKYQTEEFYHKKRGWNLGLARIYCLLATPLTNIFYKGLQLISTYQDFRFKDTLKESIAAINRGENIVIFPEDSAKGYLDHLEGFHAGFVSLAEHLYKKGIDAPIYVSYYKKKDNALIIDAPVMYSELIKDGLSREEVAQKLCDRCNELGEMNVEELLKNSTTTPLNHEISQNQNCDNSKTETVAQEETLPKEPENANEKTISCDSKNTDTELMC